MKKVKLNLAQLKVKSFEVSKNNSISGTVNANQLKSNLPVCMITDDDPVCISLDPCYPDTRA